MVTKLCLAKGLILTMVLLVMVVLIRPASAIPAFARKYQTSCATCHSVYPRLNAVGEAYRLNGYRFTDEDMYIKDEPVEMGDEAYKRVWPEAIWPTDMSGLPPISVRILNDYTIDTGGTAESRSTFDMPHEVEVFMGGTFGDNLSYFAEIEFEGGETATDATLSFDDLFGPENVFNVRVGTLLGGNAGLFTARDGNRFTKNHYQYVNWRLPYPSGFDDRNRFRGRDAQPGVELNGFDRSWYYAVGIVEGDSSLSEKDFYGMAAFKIGGLGFDGSGAEMGDSLGSAESWRDDSFIVSVFGYSGTARVNATGADEDKDKDRFWRVGPGAQWKCKDLQVGGGYFVGENDDPYGTLSHESVDSRGWFVEAAYFLYPWLIPSVRYEELDLDLPDVAGLQKGQDQGQIIASIKALIRANVTLTLEGLFHTTNQPARDTDPRGDLDDGNAVFVRLDYSF